MLAKITNYNQNAETEYVAFCNVAVILVYDSYCGVMCSHGAVCKVSCVAAVSCVALVSYVRCRVSHWCRVPGSIPVVS